MDVPAIRAEPAADTVRDAATGLMPPPSNSSGLASFPMRNSPQTLSAPGSNTQRPRRKVFIRPGHSQLDWMRLSSSGEDLRGTDQLRMLTRAEVAQHNKRNDCWMVVRGKVYNVTRYFDFHPGGRGELMRAAGKDGTELFYSTHAWVNIDKMLEKCLVGLVSERDQSDTTPSTVAAMTESDEESTSDAPRAQVGQEVRHPAEPPLS